MVIVFKGKKVAKNNLRIMIFAREKSFGTKSPTKLTHVGKKPATKCPPKSNSF
jgi:hypothetical protein